MAGCALGFRGRLPAAVVLPGVVAHRHRLASRPLFPSDCHLRVTYTKQRSLLLSDSAKYDLQVTSVVFTLLEVVSSVSG